MLHHFRKNSKIILAILGVILILSWLVVPTLTGILESSGAKQNDPVAVTWKGGQLTQGELGRLKIVHSSVVHFLNLIMQKTQALGGVSRAPGHSQQGDIGVYDDISDGSLVETMILAQRARELGVKVNDETVKNFLLINVADKHTLKEGDLAELARQATDARSAVSQGAMFEHLKTQILAQQMRLLIQTGVESMSPGDLSGPAGMPVGSLPPSEMWEIYKKLNRQIQIEAYPVKVADFVSKVAKQPTDAELQKLFEEGRRMEPSPMTSEPAFRQPYRAAFEYVDLEFEPFLEEAKKAITEEQIVEHYEKEKAAGKFKAEEPGPMTPEVKPGDKPGEDKKSGDETKPGEDKKPDDEAKPGEVKKPDDKKTDDKKAEEKPAVPEDTKPKTATPEEKPAPKKNDGSALIDNDQFVNFQADEQKKKDDKPAEPKPAEAKPGETKPSDTKPTETKPGETKPADPTAKPEVKPEAKPGDPATPEVKPAEPKEVKFKTLDEVREEIRTQLAQEPATKKRNELTAKIIAAINEYGRKFNRWKAAEDRANETKDEPGATKNTIPKPADLDFAKIVEGAGVKLEKIPLVSPFDVQEQVDDPQADGTVKKKLKYSIAGAFRIGSDFRFDGRRFPTFPEFAFDRSMPLYAADTLPFPREGNSQFMGGGGAHLWIFWRTDVQPAKELDFAAAKKQVEDYWKKREAFELAKQEASKLAEQAANGKELKTIVPNAKDVITPPGFTWLSSGSLSGQFGQPLPSRVEGIEYTGDDFREAVFGLDVGESGIAPDQPKSIVWVVRLVSEEGNLNRDRFLEKAQDIEFIIAAMMEDSRLKQGLYGELFKQYDVKFVPNASSQEE